MSAPTSTAYTYLRSTCHSAASARDGLEDTALWGQRQACLAKANSLNAQVITEYSEYGAGNTLDRPELQRLLRRLTDNPVDYVIVYDDDRLARKFDLWKELRKAIEASGAKVVACKLIPDVFQERVVELMSMFAKADHRDWSIPA